MMLSSWSSHAYEYLALCKIKYKAVPFLAVPPWYFKSISWRDKMGIRMETKLRLCPDAIQNKNVQSRSKVRKINQKHFDP